MKNGTRERVRSKRPFCLSVGAVLCMYVSICAGISAPAQDASHNENPVPAISDGEKAYQRGLVAVDQQMWNLAVASFSEAQNASPYDPRYMYALGLAHVKAGHDLAGAAWLRAYLAAAPKAENADAVRAQIPRLEQKYLANEKKIFTAAADAARQIPWLDLRWQQLRYVAGNEARVGLIDDALALEQEIFALSETIPKDRPDPPGLEHIEIADRDVVQSWLWSYDVQALSTLKDAAKASQALPHIVDPEARASALMNIADALCWSGEDGWRQQLAAAAESIAAVQDPASHRDDLISLFESYVFCRDAAGAHKAFDNFRSYAEKYDLASAPLSTQNLSYQLDSIDRADFFMAQKHDYVDEIRTRGLIAASATAYAWGLDPKTALAQAVEPDPKASGSQSAAMATKLADIAYSMGASDLNFHDLDTVDYQDNLLAEKKQLQIRCAGMLGKGFAGHIGIDTMRSFFASKDREWQQSEKGKTVMRAIAAVDDSPLEIRWVSDEKSWLAVIVLKSTGLQLYASDHYPDLTSLCFAAHGKMAEAFAIWELDDETSPLSAPYKAAVAALAGEKLP